jgi:hypothetical protein
MFHPGEWGWKEGGGGDRVWKILVQIRVHIFKVFICYFVLIAPYCWREFHSETFANCLLFMLLYVWEVGRRWWYSDWTIWISNPGKARSFSLPQNVDTSTGVHSAHLLKRYLGSFPGGKRRGRKFDRSLPCSFEVRNEWSRTSSLYMLLCREHGLLYIYFNSLQLCESKISCQVFMIELIKGNLAVWTLSDKRLLLRST